MPRGRPRKPEKLNELQGNPGRRDRQDEVEASPEPPECPDWLNDEARAEWERVIPQLAESRLLARIDRAALVCYCQAWAKLREAHEIIDREGSTFSTDKGYVVKHPAVTMANEAADQIRKFACEFGLTPLSRSRVRVPVSKPKSKLNAFIASKPK